MSPIEIKRKRQARGEARIQSLLEAAETVFGRSGYSKATTNEIAAEAAVSPATLYQFFKNKEEMANALALKHVELMREHHANVDLSKIAKLPTREAVMALLAPIFEFHEVHPAFIALFMEAPLCMETRQAKMALSATLVERVGHLLMLRKPGLAEKDAAYQAGIAMLVFRGFMSDISSATGKHKSKLIESLIDIVAMQFEKALAELE